MPDSESRAELSIEYVPLSQIITWPRNPKDHDIPLITQSMFRFGFINPLIVDERSGQLVAGHGRLESLNNMMLDRAEPPDRVRVSESGEWLVPVLRGVQFANQAEAEAYALADNQLTIVAGWNEAELGRVLADLSEVYAEEGLGWTLGEIDDLIQAYMDEDGDNEASAAEGPAEMALRPYESYDYVLVMFRTTFDWDRAVDLLGLEKRTATFPHSNSGSIKKVGLCRVLDGSTLLRKLESSSRVEKG
jgi:hypothetical protein